MGKPTKFGGVPPDGARQSGNVALFPVRTQEDFEPAFSADELRRIRQMLVEFEAVKDGCPLARRATED